MSEPRPLERCCICDDATGHAGQGDGSLYDVHGRGPFCPKCWDELRQAMVDDAGVEADNARLQSGLAVAQVALDRMVIQLTAATESEAALARRANKQARELDAALAAQRRAEAEAAAVKELVEAKATRDRIVAERDGWRNLLKAAIDEASKATGDVGLCLSHECGGCDCDDALPCNDIAGWVAHAWGNVEANLRYEAEQQLAAAVKAKETAEAACAEYRVFIQAEVMCNNRGATGKHDPAWCEKCIILAQPSPGSALLARLEKAKETAEAALAGMESCCPECHGDGYITEPEHHPNCDGSCSGGECPVPVQTQCRHPVHDPSRGSALLARLEKAEGLCMRVAEATRYALAVRCINERFTTSIPLDQLLCEVEAAYPADAEGGGR